jgi:hypothetical protein
MTSLARVGGGPVLRRDAGRGGLCPESMDEVPARRPAVLARGRRNRDEIELGTSLSEVSGRHDHEGTRSYVKGHQKDFASLDAVPGQQ